MIYEKSCGIIPFRRIGKNVEFLLLHSAMVRNPQAVWEFPKGSVEAGESEHETALRELREETHLTDVKLLEGFRGQVDYQYRRHGKPVSKVVLFFLGEVLQWSSIPDVAPTREHCISPTMDTWFLWGSEVETVQRLYHPGMRGLLTDASTFLHEHDRLNGRGYAP